MCPSGPVAFEARFRGPDRLLHSRDFQRVTRTGQRHASRYFVLLVTPRNSPGSNRPRLGITASRRVGNAVVRNRIKRLIREWFRSNRSILAATDLVVIARQPAATLSGPEIRDELTRLASEPS